MSVAVCTLKCIRNGYIDTLTCTCTQVVFDAVRNNLLNHKVLFVKETSILPFPAWREQGKRDREREREREREHCDGINDKLQKKITHLPCTNKRCICYIVSLYLGFDFSEHVSPEDI